MSMVFHYTLKSVKQYVIPLNGRFVKPRPLIPVTLVGPLGSSVERALLDTGADDTIFPVDLAQRHGIDLTNAPQGQATGFGMASGTVHYAQVVLQLAQASEQREWNAWVGFTTAPLRKPLLGFAGFLQFFHADYRGDLEEVELTVNRLYSGT